MHFVGSNSQVHCDKLQNRLSADSSNKVLFYKEAVSTVFHKTTIMSLFYLGRLATITNTISINPCWPLLTFHGERPST